MDGDHHALPLQETEPFPTITPVASQAAGPSTFATTTTTTTTTTSGPNRPTTTVTTRARPLSQSSPTSARPPFTSSRTSPVVIRNGPSPTPQGQNQVQRRPVAASPTRRPSVRIKRQPSARSVSSVTHTTTSSRPTSYASPTSAGPSRPTSYALADISEDAIEANRKRSSSEPQRPAWLMDQGDPLTRSTTTQQGSQLPAVVEESSREAVPQVEVGSAENPAELLSQDLLAPPPRDGSILRRLSVGARNAMHRRSNVSDASHPTKASEEVEAEELDPAVVDILDVLDPEVATLSTLTNVQNSLFIPDLGPLLNRQPTYILSKRPSTSTRKESLKRPQTRPPPPVPAQERPPDGDTDTDEATRPQLTQTSTISSTMTDSYYAVLPHGMSLDGWTEGEKAELNDHVRHMLHSKRSAFKRGMKGFGQYIRRPLGFFVTLYAVLITLFGAAWVLFLIGWINLGARRLYIINVIDNVLVALFAVMGDGLAPFRTWDTYNTIFIVHFWRVTRKLRKKKQLPKLKNKNDLPTQAENGVVNTNSLDLEIGDNSTKEKDDEEEGFGEGKPDEFTVLSEKQQASLELHQRRLARSHTFYKPHETVTHHAFPISYLLAIIILCDMHSLFQIALGTCTWAISYHRRPFALTTVILCCSITCNITAGVVIAIGDRKSRKKDVLDRIFRQELTAKAIRKVEKRRVKTMELENRDGLMGSVIHEGTETPRRSTDRLRRSTEMRKIPTSTPGGSASQSMNSLRPTPSVPGVKVNLVS